MRRRKFIQHTLAFSGAISVTATTAFGIVNELSTHYNFNFMQQSHPNLTLINNFFQAYAANDLAAIGKILDVDIKWHIPGKHPLSGTKTGVAQVLDYFQKLTKGAFKAESIVMGVNDKYVIDCHRNWSNLENGENLDNMSCLLWTIENGKITEVYNFPQDQHVVDLFFTKLYH